MISTLTKYKSVKINLEYDLRALIFTGRNSIRMIGFNDKILSTSNINIIKPIWAIKIIIMKWMSARNLQKPDSLYHLGIRDNI